MKAEQLVRPQPDIAAALSKLVMPEVTNLRRHDKNGNTQIDVPNQQNFRSVSESIIQKDRDSETVKQLFPEMELASQIVVASIIAPKDMSTSEISYGMPDTLKVSPLAAELSALLDEYFTQTHKIEPLLPEILNEALFGPGSYVMAVIPENSVDDLINGASTITTESLSMLANKDGVFRGLGLLGPGNHAPKNTKEITRNFSLEDFGGTGRYEQSVANFEHQVFGKIGDKVMAIDHIFVTDNPDGLKMPKVIQARHAIDVATALDKRNSYRTASFENFKNEMRQSSQDPSKLTDIQLTNLFYKNKGVSWKHTVKVKTGDEVSRRTIGEPLKLRLPSESVIPVFTPGSPDKHVGYFVLIDSEGNPIYKTSYQSEFTSLRKNAFNSNMASGLLNQAGRELNGGNCETVSFDQAAQVYADIIEADLLARLRNGVYGGAVSVARNEEIYRIMLARTLKKQNTQLMYIPIDMVTYFAYKYNTQGIGKSLFDDTLTLQSLRGMLLFSQVQGSVKNAIGRQKIKIKLTAEDPNPQGTIEKWQHEIANMARGSFPVSSLSVSDLTAWSQQAGREYEFEGHPGMPDSAVEYSNAESNHQKPDTELMEMLRSASIMAMGLSPETVDNAFSAEFATTAIQNNLLLTKRVIQIQEKIVPQISDYCRKVARNDGNFMDRATKIVKDNIGRIRDTNNADPILADFADNEPLLVHLLVQEFVSNFEVSLGRPDAAQVENTLEAIRNQSEAIEAVIGFYITDEIFPSSMAGEQVAERVNEVRAMVKAWIMRKWMLEKKIFPELTELTMLGKDGKPLMTIGNEVSTHLQSIIKTVGTLVKDARKVAEASDANLTAETGGDLGASSVGSSGGSSGGGGGSYSSGGDGGGYDDTSPDGDGSGDGGGGGSDDLMAGLPDMPKI